MSMSESNRHVFLILEKSQKNKIVLLRAFNLTRDKLNANHHKNRSTQAIYD